MLLPASTECPPFSSTIFASDVSSIVGEGDFVVLTGVQVTDLAEDELSDLPSLDTDLDLLRGGERDLDFDLLPLFFGDLDLLLLCCGERCLRDNERDLERLLDLGGERFLLAGDLERLLTGERVLDFRRGGGVLDLLRLRGLLDLERRVRLGKAMDRERVRLLLRTDRERER